MAADREHLDDDQLLGLLAEAFDDVVDREPPADRVAGLRALVEADRLRLGSGAPTTGAPTTGAPAVEAPTPIDRRAPRRRLLVVAAAAAASALVFGLGWAAGRPGGEGGELEFAGPAVTEGATASQLDIRRTGDGRVVRLRTDDLADLPSGQFYEMWFARPGAEPDALAVVSAGTFRPDPAGRADVRFPSGVDPADYPLVLVTAEPGDDDPAPSGDVVLQFELA